MKTYIKTLLIVYTGFFLCLNLVQCSSLGKIAPDYSGVDPRAEHFVKEYKELAAMQGITFKNEISIGFKKLNDGAAVGITYYGPGDLWREIVIDPEYWNHSTEIRKSALLFHELSHGYCTRKHDWGNGSLYPEYETWKKGREPKEGRYKDGTGCPLSLMFPMVVDDFCVLTHYGDYTIEMFNRCRPY